jgi:hypothetical protein
MKCAFVLSAAAILAATSPLAMAQAVPAPSLSAQALFGELDRSGFDVMAASRQDLVQLQTAGTDCRDAEGKLTARPALETAAQLMAATCTMSAMMREANVSPDEIVAARVRYTKTEDAAALRDFVASNALASAQLWVLEHVEALPVESPYMRFSVEMLATSPDSDATLKALR